MLLLRRRRRGGGGVLERGGGGGCKVGAATKSKIKVGVVRGGFSK